MGGKSTTSIFEAALPARAPGPHEPIKKNVLFGGRFPLSYRGASHTQRSPTYISGNQRLTKVLRQVQNSYNQRITRECNSRKFLAAII
jgi:hypothetical protein